jgi:hypothetical protein
VRRRLFNFVAGVSLVWCLATVAFCVRSYRRMDIVRIKTSTRWVAAALNQGQLQTSTWPRSAHDPPVSAGWESVPANVRESAGPSPLWSSWFAGFGYGHDMGISGMQLVVLPAWWLIAITAVLPAVWIYHRIRRRRWKAQHRCAHCGYDLRATPDRCPECGTQAKPQAAEGAAA